MLEFNHERERNFHESMQKAEIHVKTLKIEILIPAPSDLCRTRSDKAE
jgi:hypothetical protein